MQSSVISPKKRQSNRTKAMIQARSQSVCRAACDYDANLRCLSFTACQVNIHDRDLRTDKHCMVDCKLQQVHTTAHKNHQHNQPLNFSAHDSRTRITAFVAPLVAGTSNAQQPTRLTEGETPHWLAAACHVLASPQCKACNILHRDLFTAGIAVKPAL